MSNDYILREEAIAYIKEVQCKTCSDIGLCGKCAVLTAVKLFESIPPADGRLIVLPCKPGDTVYYLTGNPALVGHFDRVESTRVLGFYWDENGLQICLKLPRGSHGTYGYFEETVFLTREEAEEALRKDGGH